MKPINVFLIVMIALAISYYRQNVIFKKTGERIMARMYDLEQTLQPEFEQDGIPIFSDRGYAKIAAYHNCQQIVYEEFQLWK